VVVLFALDIVACGDGGNASSAAGPAASLTASAIASPVASPAVTLAPTVAAEALTERGPFPVGVTTLTLMDESQPTDANGDSADAGEQLDELGRRVSSQLRDAA